MKEKFDIIGMTCASCQANIQKTVSKLNGIKAVNVNLLSNSMSVEYDEKILSAEKIVQAVERSGYKAIMHGGSDNAASVENINKKELSKSRFSLIWSIIFVILLLYVSMGHMFGAPLPDFLVGTNNAVSFAFTQLLLTLPIIAVNYSYFTVGFKQLFRLKPNMDSLIAIGASAALLYGIFAIYRISYGLGTGDTALADSYHMDLYFESAGTILALVRIGKFMEVKSKAKTTDAIGKLIALTPKTAVILENGVETVKKIDEIKVGDIIVVKAGGTVAADGQVTNGTASVDQSNITGESVPVFKAEGDKVIASTVVRSGSIQIKAEKVGKDTAIENIIRLVKEASDSKAPISGLADKVSGVFVPIVIAIAVVAFAVWLGVGATFEFAMSIGIAVLVIACPCALGLATPVAIMVGTGKGAENGLLIKSAESLEQAHNIATVVLDKTGTITEGKPAVCNISAFGETTQDELIELAYAIENKSEHPLADSIIRYAKDNGVKLLNAEDYKAIEGKGVSGRINGRPCYAGNYKLIKELGLQNGEIEAILRKSATSGVTPLLFASDKKLLGIIEVKDTIKPSSIEAVKELKAMNIEAVMLTGDNRATAEAIAEEAGIDRVIADVLPIDKQSVINNLKSDSKHLVAMVGDGVNDALALTASDVGIAIGAGTDIAIDSADIVLIRNDLRDVVNVIRLSKRVIGNIKVNLFWAFFYNVIGIMLATGAFYFAGIKLNPMISALAMSLSSVCVVANALTINFFKVKRENRECNYGCMAAHRILKEEECNILEGINACGADDGTDVSNVKPTENKKQNNPAKRGMNNEKETDMKEIIIKVNGMTCPHCEARVNKALLEVDGVTEASASAANNEVRVKAKEDIDIDSLYDAVDKTDYEAVRK